MYVCPEFSKSLMWLPYAASYGWIFFFFFGGGVGGEGWLGVVCVGQIQANKITVKL